MDAMRALSIAFWSAARLLLISFFCEFVNYRFPVISLFLHSYLWLLSLLEESVLASLVLNLVASEVLGLGDLLDLLLVQTSNVNLDGCGNDVTGVHTAQGNTVDLEGASDQKDTLLEGLDEDNTLATEAASKQDQDGTGLKGLARSPSADGLADLQMIELVTVPAHVLVRQCVAKSRVTALAMTPTAFLDCAWRYSTSAVRGASHPIFHPGYFVAEFRSLVLSSTSRRAIVENTKGTMAGQCTRVAYNDRSCIFVSVATYNLGLGLIVGRVPLLSSLGVVGDLPG